MGGGAGELWSFGQVRASCPGLGNRACFLFLDAFFVAES